MLKRVIAFDPGGTTGVAALSYDTDNEIKRDAVVTSYLTFSGWSVAHLAGEHHSLLWETLVSLNPDVIVCESFEFRQGKQRNNINLMSKEYIGVIKLFSQQWTTSVVFQTAALGKGFVTDEKIKALDLWVPGRKHAMDAMRHLITYLVQKERRIELARPWKDL